MTPQRLIIRVTILALLIIGVSALMRVGTAGQASALSPETDKASVQEREPAENAESE